MKSKLAILAFCFALIVYCHAEETKSALTTDVRIERGVSYLAEGRKEKADLYLPAVMPKDKRLPALVVIHGGGWQSGKRDAARELNIGTTLARNGYVAMSIDYMLASHSNAVWPTNLWDCKTAVRWLRKNANRLGIDPDRIGVSGGSAGGHLSAMVALTTPSDKLDPPGPYSEYSCQVKCCIDMYGISDIVPYHDVTMLGKPLADAPELYRAASPVNYLRSNSPPILIMHGTADKTVALEQSQMLADKLEKVGAKHELVIIPGAPHSFDFQPKQRDLRPVVLEFLKNNL